jgi:hypothetical protein
VYSTSVSFVRPLLLSHHINYTLQDYLNEFCLAYINDILIYLSGSKRQHQEHVCKILQQLQNTGLQVNINKCEFKVQFIKYLRFIIKARKGLRIDPAKVKAIKD